MKRFAKRASRGRILGPNLTDVLCSAGTFPVPASKFDWSRAGAHFLAPTTGFTNISASLLRSSQVTGSHGLAKPAKLFAAPQQGSALNLKPGVSFILLLIAVCLCTSPPSLAAPTSQPVSDLAFSPGQVIESIKGLIVQYSGSPVGLLIFLCTYTGAAILLLPAPFLTLVAGAIYGTLEGTALVSASSTFAACTCFLISRYVARPSIAARLESSPRFQRIDRGIATSGVKVVLLLRLSPFVPFGLLNYMLGLTQISFVQFALASWAGMLPATVAYVSLGGAGKAGYAGSMQPAKLAVYALGAIASVLAVAVLGRIANEALPASSEQEQESMPPDHLSR